MEPTTATTHDRADGGFTLLEVVVALALLGVVATAALTMFLGSVGRADDMQERQVAISVANEVVEQAHAVDAVAGTSTSVLYAFSYRGTTLTGTGTAQTSGLVLGRSRDEVLTAWAATEFPGKTTTRPAWDAAASPGAEALPVTTTTTVANTAYTTTTLIGTCTLSVSGRAGDCTTTGTGALLQRVVVHVTWAGCGSTCTYDTTTLLDPRADQAWRVSS